MRQKTKDELRLERRAYARPVDGGGLVLASLWPMHNSNLGILGRTADAFDATYAVPTSTPGWQIERRLMIGVDNLRLLRVPEPLAWLAADAPRPVIAVELADGALPVSALPALTEATIVLGNERGGVPQEALDLADVVVEIPQAGVGNCLNVSIAGAIVLAHVFGATGAVPGTVPLREVA